MESSALLDQLLELTVLVGIDMDQTLSQEGLTTPRAHLLWVLQETGPTNQRVLADLLDVSPRNVTGLVDGLVETGFVTREPHPQDRRAALISFTPKGATVTARLSSGHAELAEDLFDDLSARDRACLHRSLEHVLDQLRDRVESEDD